MARVEIRPLPIEKWHKKKDSDAFSSPKTVEAQYSDAIGGYDTGLTDEEVIEFGKKLGVSLSKEFNPDEPHPFYGTKAGQVQLPSHTLILNTDSLRDLVKVRMLKAGSTKWVANTLKEWEEDKWDSATHYIHDEEEEAEAKGAVIARKRKANLIVSELSKDAKIAIIMVLRRKNLKGKSDSLVDVELDDILENDLTEFFKAHSLGREEITLRAQVEEMLEKNILTRQGAAIYYMGNQISFDIEGAVGYFQDPNNAGLKVMLLDKLSLR